jgi:ribulose-5-phosphate 4-epimerase/fuculose-1-phosphate aldolase
LSVIMPGDAGLMVVTPAACHWQQVKASTLVVIDAEGRNVDCSGDYDRSAYCIHYPIHAAREDAVCVLHAHPPYATALSMVKGARLQMASQNALGLHERIAYYEDWDGFVLDLAHGERLATALGDKRVMFLGNHGVLVVGASVAAAYYDLYQLERACMFQCRAMTMAAALGSEIRPIANGEALSARAKLDAGGGYEKGDYKTAYFAAMRRLLDAQQPDYAD